MNRRGLLKLIAGLPLAATVGRKAVGASSEIVSPVWGIVQTPIPLRNEFAVTTTNEVQMRYEPLLWPVMYDEYTFGERLVSNPDA